MNLICVMGGWEANEDGSSRTDRVYLVKGGPRKRVCRRFIPLTVTPRTEESATFRSRRVIGKDQLD